MALAGWTPSSADLGSARQLLPHEPLDAGSFEVSRRWLAIYEHLNELIFSGDGSGHPYESSGPIPEGLRYWQRRTAELAGIGVDIERRVVVFDSSLEVSLTGREAQLLAFMAAHAGSYFPDRELATRAWGGNRSSDQVRIYVQRLRGKLAAGGWSITATRGRGYALVKSPNGAHRPTASERPTSETVAQTSDRTKTLMGWQQADLQRSVQLVERRQNAPIEG